MIPVPLALAHKNIAMTQPGRAIAHGLLCAPWIVFRFSARSVRFRFALEERSHTCG